MSRWYDDGTEVQQKRGRVLKKIRIDDDTTKWVGRGRYVYMKTFKVDLDQDQRVFHIDGDKANDDPKNLVPIRFGGPVYNLAHAKVVWSPKPLTKKQKTVTV